MRTWCSVLETGCLNSLNSCLSLEGNDSVQKAGPSEVPAGTPGKFLENCRCLIQEESCSILVLLPAKESSSPATGPITWGGKREGQVSKRQNKPPSEISFISGRYLRVWPTVGWAFPHLSRQRGQFFPVRLPPQVILTCGKLILKLTVIDMFFAKKVGRYVL